MVQSEAILHRSLEELRAALSNIALAPKDGGAIALIVVRPDHGVRETPNEVWVSAAKGVEGDHWSKECWRTTDDGAPHPGVQINLMSVRAAEAIAGEPARWPAAGNNFFVDLDMSPENLPPGTRLALGTAEIEISQEPNKGCNLFVERYGRDACVFVNVGKGRDLRTRGLYARVVKDGAVCIGDMVRKL
ncbi:MAG: MOSC domain-containing protein [Boseongicola sp.]|nr:MOSC domain-containing protein [Boseongicola sp.]